MRRPETTFLSIGQKFPGDAFSMNLIDMVIPTNPAFSLNKSSHVMPNFWLFATHPKVVIHLHMACVGLRFVRKDGPIGGHRPGEIRWHVCHACSEGHACHARGTGVDYPTWRSGRDKRVPPRGGRDKRVPRRRNSEGHACHAPRSLRVKPIDKRIPNHLEKRIVKLRTIDCKLSILARTGRNDRSSNCWQDTGNLTYFGREMVSEGVIISCEPEESSCD